MRQILGLIIVVPAVLVATACGGAPATPTSPPPPSKATAAPKAEAPKPTEAAKPTAAPAKPTEAPAAKATEKPAEKPAAKEITGLKLADKPGAPPFVAPVMNASGTFNPANTLVLYGDMALFAGRDNPDNCILKSRYKRGEPVGFRMTAIDPVSGKFAENAQLVVKIPLGNKVETVEMRYRGTGDNPRPGFWTAKWVVPDDAPTGVIKYWVEARTPDGKTAVWAPYNIEASMLTIVP